MIRDRDSAVAEFQRIAEEDPRVHAAFLGGDTAELPKGESFLASADRTRTLKMEIKELLETSGAKYPDELEKTVLEKFGRT